MGIGVLMRSKSSTVFFYIQSLSNKRCSTRNESGEGLGADRRDPVAGSLRDLLCSGGGGGLLKVVSLLT